LWGGQYGPLSNPTNRPGWPSGDHGTRTRRRGYCPQASCARTIDLPAVAALLIVLVRHPAKGEMAALPRRLGKSRGKNHPRQAAARALLSGGGPYSLVEGDFPIDEDMVPRHRRELWARSGAGRLPADHLSSHLSLLSPATVARVSSRRPRADVHMGCCSLAARSPSLLPFGSVEGHQRGAGTRSACSAPRGAPRTTSSSRTHRDLPVGSPCCQNRVARHRRRRSSLTRTEP